ncbi:MAG: histidine triad nucleotide-binding protein [Dehalococcoidales bacterium]|nr:histidine triad nucleotide-binding protein [Dehalococcoidales bacterium]
MDCIFCQIATGKIPSDILYQDSSVIAFRDISPQSPTHILIIPKKHITSLAQLPDAEAPLIGHMAMIANKLAREQNIAESGYRVVINCGKQGGQLVPHLHMHLLGGRQLSGTLG